MTQTTLHGCAPLLASLILACRPPSAEPPVSASAAETESAGDSAAPTEPIAELVVVPMVSASPSDPSTWRYDPDGRFIAAPVGEHCGLFEVETGYFGGTFPGAVTDAKPCVEWPPLEHLEAVEAAGRGPDSTRVVFGPTELRFETDDSLRFAQTCSGCEWVGAAVEDRGLRIAGAWIDAGGKAGLRIFDVTGKVLHELSLAAKGKFVEDVDLVWRSNLVALTEVRPWDCQGEGPTCREAPAIADSVSSWARLDAPPEVTPLPNHMESIGLRSAYVDPLGDFLWLTIARERSREGIGVELASIPLRARETDLSWRAAPLPGSPDYEPLDYVSEHQRVWLAGPHTRFVAASLAHGIGEGHLDWTLFDLGHPVHAETGFQGFELPSDEVQWRIYDIGHDTDTDTDSMEGFEVRGCFVDSARQTAEEIAEQFDLSSVCDERRILPKGCMVEAASVALDRVLGRCLDRLVMARFGETTTRPLSAGPIRAWSWSQAGLLTLDDTGEARVWDPKGERERSRWSGIDGLQPAALAEELGLGLIRWRKGKSMVLEVVNSSTAMRGPVLEFAARPVHAAFAPDGSLLAVSDGREIAVFSLEGEDSGQREPLARWSPAKISGLAFRQDSAILFSGRTQPLPEDAWNPITGEARDAERPSDALLERLATGDLERSWRWSIHADGWITRTLDGHELLLEPTAALADTGWMSGDPEDIKPTLRVGNQPGDPVFEAKELFTLLEHPELIHEFFAGAVIERPLLSKAQVEAALAAR